MKQTKRISTFEEFGRETKFNYNQTSSLIQGEQR